MTYPLLRNMPERQRLCPVQRLLFGTVHLIQILLPLNTNDGRKQPPALFAAVAQQLSDRHGGLTAYTRAPATGLWNEGPNATRDEVIIIEVMVEQLQPQWWQAFRRQLEIDFEQQEVVVRALTIDRL